MVENINGPKVTVFMAAYNAEPFIAEAISSILGQSFENFELLIVNDGSTDRTVEVIQSFTDPRIKLIHNGTNKGLAYTRNRALDEAQGEFIAVLDSDDIAVSDRLQLQYDYMTNHQEVALCSGHAALIDGRGRPIGQQFIVPTGNAVNMEMFFGNPFINSAAMFRADVLKEFHGYREFVPAEDFDFFLRISEKYPVANMDRLLVYYRVHDQNISTIQSARLRQVGTDILKDMYNRWGIPVDEQFLDLHYLLFEKNYSSISCGQVLSVMSTLKGANMKSGRFPIKDYDALLFKKWYEIIMIKKPGKAALPLLFSKELFDPSSLTFKQFRRAFKQTFWALLGKK